MKYIDRSRAACAVIAFAGFGCAPSPPSVAMTPEDKAGILVMAHGGSDQWNRAVEDLIEPLRAKVPTALAFGMADPVTLQAAVDTLEELDVTRITVVRLFVSGRSFLARTEFLFGLRPNLPGVDAPPTPLRLNSEVSLRTNGLVDSPLVGAVLADRVRTLSTSPSDEAILIIAHGMGHEDDNLHLLERLDAIADSVRQFAAFHTVRVATLREDSRTERAPAEEDIRSFVANETHHGRRVIVVPFRLSGFGPYGDVLDGLDYVSDGIGLIPHSKITEWIWEQLAVSNP